MSASVAASDAEIRDRPYSKITWRIMPFLLLCYLTAYIDRVNIGFAKLQMGSDLGLSEAAYGLGAGIFFIGYALFEVPSNLVLHKVGARRWIARILVTWGLISAGFGIVRDETIFYILRFFLGAAEAGFAPGALLYLTYWFPAARRSRANSILFLAIPSAGIFGAPLSGLIMEKMAGLHGWEGWRWMFVIEAVPAILAGIATFFVLPERPDSVNWLTPVEKRLVLDDLAGDQAVRTEHLSVSQFLADRRLWLLTAIYFAVVMGQYAITFWLPTIIKSAGATTPLHNGLLTSIPFLATAVAIVMLGVSADRTGERRYHLIAPMAAGAAALILASLYPHNLGLSILCLSVAAAGLISATVMFWSLPPAFLGGVWAAAGIGAINSLGNVAGFVSPYVIGAFVNATGDIRFGLYAIAAAVLGGMMLVFLVPKTVNR
jgi:D-galactonate transporter